MIYTSYFDNLKYIDKNIVPISISLYSKYDYKDLEFKVLAPRPFIFKRYRIDKNKDVYVRNYIKFVLNLLDVKEVINELYKMSNGKDIVLLCYEKEGLFCHRHIISRWLKHYGYECEEYIPDIIIN